jgi:hypothetical protein
VHLVSKNEFTILGEILNIVLESKYMLDYREFHKETNKTYFINIGVKMNFTGSCMHMGFLLDCLIKHTETNVAWCILSDYLT